MTVLVAILCILSLKLWNDLSAATRRLDMLEKTVAGRWTADASPASAPVTDVAESAETVIPAPEARTSFEPGPSRADRWDLPPEAVAATTDRSPPRLHSQSYEAEEAVHWADIPPSPTFPTVRAGSGLEDLFGRTLPIWAGGITLAIAGILIVKWSIDAGLLSPAVRVALGMLFGLGLVGGAEWSLRGRVADDRIPQALAGAGVASLYGAVLAANIMYGLMGDGTTMASMIALTVLAGMLSMRFGAPSAVLGLVGGLVAPALVGGAEADVALMSVYVAMISGGAGALARFQGWSWLGFLSMTLATLWSLVLSSHAQPAFPAAALGTLMLFAGFAIPRIAISGEQGAWLRTAGAVLAVVQAAFLLGAGGYGPVQWLMMAIATAVILWTSEDNEAFRDMPSIALGVFVVMAAAWSAPTEAGLALVVIGFCAMHAIHALRHLSFCDYPRLANGLRLIVLPVLACALFDLHMHLDGVRMLIVWGVGGLATAGAIGLVSASDLEEPASWCQPLAVGMVLAGLSAVLPSHAMPAAILAVTAALSFVRGWRIGMAAAAVVCLACSASVVGAWMLACIRGVADPLLTGDLPLMLDVARAAMPAAVAVAIAGWRLKVIRTPAAMAVGIIGLVIVHVAWRRMVGVATLPQFADLGMFDRSGWEALLLAAAIMAWRIDRGVATALALASLSHFAWFTEIRFNPLWSAQAVGSLPLANMVALSHVAPLAMLWVAGRAVMDHPTRNRTRRIAQMTLVASLGFTLVRQMFAGSMMAGAPVSDIESIAHSATAILLAIGFLVFSMRTSSVEWRAGSLVLMLGAVSKVFLMDAAGLDGLARVASFAGLGFSLIGVGWLYSRLLPGGYQSGGIRRVTIVDDFRA